MWVSPLVALLLQVTLAVAAGLLARRAKLAAVLLGAAGFVGAPWLAGNLPLVRGVDTLLGGFALLRVLDLVRGKEEWDARRRLAHLFSFVDSRTLRAAPRHLALGAIGRALAWNALAAIGLYLAHTPSLLLRWAGGLVLVYAAIEAGYELVVVAYRALGFIPPRLHVLPVASLSVTELWGKRWARPVSACLRDTCFLPMVRRGHPKAGLVLAFVASAVGHAYPVLVALDPSLAAMMFTFFFAQAAFVVLEATLGASRWPRPLRRSWTIAAMVASSPLFVEPALRVLGLPPVG